MPLPSTELNTRYPTLSKYSGPLAAPERQIVGRDREISQLMAAMSRPELCNALLLAPPGSGKTALVQAASIIDTARDYLEVDLARMIAGLSHSDEMAAQLKTLFDEAEEYSRQEARQLVLFIDEFHQIVQLSAAAVEALKPVLAASGARGIRVIAATTDEEFDQYVKPNQPLVERLQRIIVSPPGMATTIAILKGMAARYEVADQIYDEGLLPLIYEYTERYVPAATQPRKSILVLDSMVGWHLSTGRNLDRKLLADVLQESVGVNVALAVDAAKIKSDLDSKVFSQHWATHIVAQRLQLCVADLHDKTKPASSFLFAGSTGVGKSELTKQLAQLMFGDARKHLIRFDMTEYARDESLDLFRTELTSRVWHTSHAVVLLDEVEKASAMVNRLLLQVLDDGRLSDANGRQVSFLNTYIVMTTNAGAEIFKTIAQYSPDATGSGQFMKDKMKEITRSITQTQAQNRFPPELLGRIDAIVPFQPLARETQRQIIHNKLAGVVQEVLTKHGVMTTMDERVLEYLVEDKADTDAEAGGARAAVRLLTSDVTTQIATFINAHPKVRAIHVEVEGELRSENKSLRESSAEVVVKLPILRAGTTV
ncbi:MULTISPECIES: AAA family ATPase [unclassified Microbacterium]|uniref:AAA family ATPase n=1 Tax=unclassified Microbacterium TaxID=2609290 RepID=UPI0028833B32|nr:MULTISPECIES: AAA family ATPase [unclassified Microbacterium]